MEPPAGLVYTYIYIYTCPDNARPGEWQGLKLKDVNEQMKKHPDHVIMTKAVRNPQLFLGLLVGSPLDSQMRPKGFLVKPVGFPWVVQITAQCFLCQGQDRQGLRARLQVGSSRHFQGPDAGERHKESEV